MRVFPFIVLGSLAISGCADVNSIHRVSKVAASTRSVYKDKNIRKEEKRAPAQIITVDAKQRHLLVNPEAPGSFDSENGWRVCAEAAPDVFSAYASSIGANAGTSQGKASAAFSSSIAESAATIERTQTVNLLRESMYRTCERYLSGAISKEIFVIQAARDQKSMVSVLAIEQLTGAIRPRSTVITGPSTGAGAVNGEQASKLIGTAMMRRDNAKGEHDAAVLALRKGKEAGLCDTPAEGEDATDSKADPAECTRLAAEEQAKADELSQAETNLADATKLAANLTSGANASTTSGETRTGGITKADIDADMVKEVAHAVTAIALAPPINETLMWCIATLSQKVSSDRAIYTTSSGQGTDPRPVDIDPDIKNMCLGVMRNSAAQDVSERQAFESSQKRTKD